MIIKTKANSRLFSKVSAVLLSLTFLAACGENSVSKNANSDINVDRGVRLYVFDCGNLRFESMAIFNLSDDETDIRELIVPCYIIDHPKGIVLWDGGLPSVTAAVSDWQPDPDNEGIDSKLNKTLADQLRDMALGFSLSELSYVGFSHIHFDHVGVANEVKGATWLVQRGDYDLVMADGAQLVGFDPTLVSGLRSLPVKVLDDDFDIFGDGKVQIINAPGHTPGHQVLYLELENLGPLILSGDLYHTKINRSEKRVPIINVDVDQTRKSMDKVEKLIAETGAALWIEHDLALFKTLETAPAYYD